MSDRFCSIGLVGARALPESFRSLVSGVVSYLVDRGYHIHSGGALGTDQFVLDSVISCEACRQSAIFSAWSSVSGFPLAVRDSVERFLAYGGLVDWGFVPPRSPRGAVISGLLARNQRLVSASSGIVAFLYGESRGTRRTVAEAIRQGCRVIVFLCGDGASLPVLSSGRWVRLGGRVPFSGAFLFLPEIPAQRQPTMEASGAVRALAVEVR